MSRSKLRKSKQKLKSEKDDKSKIIGRVEEESVGARCEELSSESCACEREREREPQKCVKFTGRKVKSSKQVHFSVLPDKYEPLEEDTASDTAREDNRSEKHENYKRFRKVCAAFVNIWICYIMLNSIPPHLQDVWS